MMYFWHRFIESVIMKHRSWLLALAIAFCTSVFAQPKYEFRGVWIATVNNIDWPTHGNWNTEKGTLTIMQGNEISSASKYTSDGNYLMFENNISYSKPAAAIANK